MKKIGLLMILTAVFLMACDDVNVSSGHKSTTKEEDEDENKFIIPETTQQLWEAIRDDIWYGENDNRCRVTFGNNFDDFFEFTLKFPPRNDTFFTVSARKLDYGYPKSTIIGSIEDDFEWEHFVVSNGNPFSGKIKFDYDEKGIHGIMFYDLNGFNTPSGLIREYNYYNNLWLRRK